MAPEVADLQRHLDDLRPRSAQATLDAVRGVRRAFRDIGERLGH